MIFGILCVATGSSADEMPERRAIAFLERHVSRWNDENHCFSCHNNGNAARALFASRNTPFATPLNDASTWAFLTHPDRWDDNGGDHEFSDKTLARVQFAAALGEAVANELAVEPSALNLASTLVVEDQADDGSWPIDRLAAVGSPATYGPPVATALAVRTLRVAKREKKAIARAERWVRDRPIQNIHDAFAAIVVLSPETDRDRIAAAIDLLGTAQNDDGGWGPFPRSPSEPFDTSLALIALQRVENTSETLAMRRKGRDYLVTTQNDDGGWPGTTRPSGGESYAERVSTSAWATMALLATDPRDLRAATTEP